MPGYCTSSQQKTCLRRHHISYQQSVLHLHQSLRIFAQPKQDEHGGPYRAFAEFQDGVPQYHKKLFRQLATAKKSRNLEIEMFARHSGRRLDFVPVVTAIEPVIPFLEQLEFKIWVADGRNYDTDKLALKWQMLQLQNSMLIGMVGELGNFLEEGTLWALKKCTGWRLTWKRVEACQETLSERLSVL